MAILEDFTNSKLEHNVLFPKAAAGTPRAKTLNYYMRTTGRGGGSETWMWAKR